MKKWFWAKIYRSFGSKFIGEKLKIGPKYINLLDTRYNREEVLMDKIALIGIEGLGDKRFNFSLEALFTIKGELQPDGSRLVKKADINFSKMERELKNTGRKKAKRDLEYLIQVNNWQVQDNGDILIPTIKNYFIKSSTEFLYKLVSTLSREAAAIYAYLWNKYCYYGHFDFTYDELCIEVLGIQGGSATLNIENTKSHLYELVLHGLLTYRIRKRMRPDGKFTYRREVIYMADRFVALEALQEMETKLTEDSVEEENDSQWDKSEEIEQDIIVGFQPTIQSQLLQLPTLYLVFKEDDKNKKRLLKYSELYLDGAVYSEEELKKKNVKIVWVQLAQRAQNNFQL